jgi:isopentenyldiphosphate isomerase
VVDDDDVVVAVVPRSEMRARRLQHRCVFIVVCRTDGRVLVHQRSPDKDIWPSAWDLAAGGVVHSGEPWDAAAARELEEEVGVTRVALRLVRKRRYADAEVQEVACVYTATWDGPVTFNDGEVVAARWVTPGELAALLGSERFCPDSVALAADLVL